MHGSGKSDPPIVPGKRPNKSGRPDAEAVEGRGGAKGTAGRQSTGRTQSRETVSQALACVREAANRNRSERFTSLMHHVTPELLAWAFHQLKVKAAPGVDGVTWEEYAGALDANVDDLHRRVMRGGYRAKPSRRQYIPKADQWRKRKATGEVIVIRYADDTIVGFKLYADAERFLRDLRERLAKFGLALHPEKTVWSSSAALRRRVDRCEVWGNRRPSPSSASRTSAAR